MRRVWAARHVGTVCDEIERGGVAMWRGGCDRVGWHAGIGRRKGGEGYLTPSLVVMVR